MIGVSSNYDNILWMAGWKFCYNCNLMSSCCLVIAKIYVVFTDIKLFTAYFLQADIKRQEWNKKWLLKFIEEECTIMLLGRRNSAYQYLKGYTPLSTTEVEKDLWIYHTWLPLKAKSMPNGRLVKRDGPPDVSPGGQPTLILPKNFF